MKIVALCKRQKDFFTSGLLDLRNNVSSGTMSTSLTCHSGKQIFNENINTVCKRKKQDVLCVWCVHCVPLNSN